MKKIKLILVLAFFIKSGLAQYTSNANVAKSPHKTPLLQTSIMSYQTNGIVDNNRVQNKQHLKNAFKPPIDSLLANIDGTSKEAYYQKWKSSVKTANTLTLTGLGTFIFTSVFLPAIFPIKSQSVIADENFIYFISGLTLGITIELVSIPFYIRALNNRVKYKDAAAAF
jgi:hypothetical protein